MVEENKNGNGSGVGLKIVVKDKDGNVTAERCKDDDIFLKNWGLLVAGWLKYAFLNSAAGSYIFHKTSGETVTITSAIWGYAVQRYVNVGRICLGGSSTAPTVDDYRLGSEITQIVPNIPALVYDGNILKIIFTGTASFEGDVTLSEVGLQVENPLADGTNILITRDIFDSVTVAAGGTITVQFEIWFNGMPA